MKKHRVIDDKKENKASRLNFEKKIKEYIEILDERINHLIKKSLDISDEGREKYDVLLSKLIKQRKELALMKFNFFKLGEEKGGDVKESIHYDFECLKDEVEVTYESIISLYNHIRKNLGGFGDTDQTRDDGNKI